MRNPIRADGAVIERSSLRLAPHARTSHYGFTLIEILIVLAIIGILAAILLPVFNSARESARTATCSGNLKQIYLGTQMYLRDSDGTYPNDGYGATNCDWANLIYPYAKSTGIFECPNAEHGEFRTGCPPNSEDGEDKWDGSYSYNILRVGTRQFIRESLVGQPSQVALFVDGSGSIFTPYGSAGYDLNITAMQNLALTERGHNEGLNVCFADGHIKRVAADAFFHRDLWLNTRDADYNLHAP